MTEEISLDIEELKSLLAIAKRPAVQRWIQTQIETLISEQRVQPAPTEPPATVSPSMAESKVSSLLNSSDGETNKLWMG
ncbi:hypothetical protein KIN20_025870 [Parelaphostrongylus tenuis]|uniref:Siah interacting protein N-terminal domain-containing protein n=1 Tax=Parelaphostrongylus tenuis TaxID=148309 RepID=A0AAD5MYX0_PARTN|nr:hypothetical protein KIN20_025870 [Parelaphostrongylus tenuis]